MREGRLLAEESPSRLLTLFNSETLEDVFLTLSRRQEEGKLPAVSSLPVVDDQNNSVIVTDNTGSRTSVATVSTFEIGHGSTDVSLYANNFINLLRTLSNSLFNFANHE